jgi:hypothetical protein
MIKKFLILICLIFSFGLQSQAGSTKIVKLSEPVELRIFQIELNVDSKIDKFENYITPCLPALSTQKEVYDLFLTDTNTVEIQKFEYLNADEVLKNCPDQAVLKVRVRYLSK